MQMGHTQNRGVTIVLGCFQAGGMERVTINLANGLVAEGIPVDLVVGDGSGPMRAELANGVHLVDLQSGRAPNTLLPLARYLRERRPGVMLSVGRSLNGIAWVATKVARYRGPLVLAEHTTVSHALQQDTSRQHQLGALLARQAYRRADTVVSVSQGAARDLMETLAVPAKQIRVLYNPVITDRLEAVAREPADLPWPQNPEIPMLIALGRFAREKNYTGLLDAFAGVRRQRPARLLLLGDGPDRPELEDRVREHGLEDDVAMPGFRANPYAPMARADLLVLSSRHEALPTVLIEALALGVPIVATDCDNGPREILDGGRLGRLVPVGDTEALTAAILAHLEAVHDRDALRARGEEFSVAPRTREYIRLFEDLLSQPRYRGRYGLS